MSRALLGRGWLVAACVRGQWPSDEAEPPTKPQPTHFHGPIMNSGESSGSGRRDRLAEEDTYTINHLAELLHGDEVIIQSILTNMVLAQGISHITAPSVNLAFS